jgi:hypothetical protein
MRSERERMLDILEAIERIKNTQQGVKRYSMPKNLSKTGSSII